MSFAGNVADFQVQSGSSGKAIMTCGAGSQVLSLPTATLSMLAVLP
jgi:hypothetical protein